MKRIFIILSVLVAVGSADAAQDLSLGLYGGINDPVIQQDTKSGPDYGIKATYSPATLFAIGLFFERRAYGNVSETVFSGTEFERQLIIDGGKVNAYGAQALIGNNGRGIGAHLYWMFGIGRYDWTRADHPRFSRTFYHVGPGLEVGITNKIGIEGSAKLEVIPTERNGSRKNILALMGINYHLAL